MEGEGEGGVGWGGRLGRGGCEVMLAFWVIVDVLLCFSTVRGFLLWERKLERGDRRDIYSQGSLEFMLNAFHSML